MADKANNRGRASKVTDEKIIGRLLDAIKLGLTYDSACDYAGISRTSFFNWINWGKEGKKKIYIDFLDKLKKAESLSEANLVKDIRTDSSWQSKAWILERRWPEKWGRDRHTKSSAEVIEMEFEYKVIDSGKERRKLDREDKSKKKAVKK